MRYALPLIYCVDEETQAKLLGMITDINSVPRCEWVEWRPDKRPVEIDRGIDYDKFIRQAPSKSRI